MQIPHFGYGEIQVINSTQQVNKVKFAIFVYQEAQTYWIYMFMSKKLCFFFKTELWKRDQKSWNITVWSNRVENSSKKKRIDKSLLPY